MTRSSQVSETLRTGMRGFTLVELIVAMVLLGLILTMVGGLFISTTRDITLARNINQNARQAANGMNEIARVIRAGTDNPVAGQSLNDPAFVIATNEAVVLYAYINLDSAAQQPMMIRLSLDSSRRLVESRWPATALANGNWSFPSCTSATTCSVPPATSRVLAAYVAPAAAAPWLFTYLQSDGSALTIPAGGFTATQFRTIASVRVNLKIQTSVTDATKSVTLQNTVGIPNLSLAKSGGS